MRPVEVSAISLKRLMQLLKLPGAARTVEAAVAIETVEVARTVDEAARAIEEAIGADGTAETLVGADGDVGRTVEAIEAGVIT